MKAPKLKIITQNGRLFLLRLSIPLSQGSIKFHLIANDDLGDPHIHPWEFTSFLMLGAYKEQVNGRIHNHWPFSLVCCDRAKAHRVILYKVFGFKLPCLTVGKYTEKVQPWCKAVTLCDRCKVFGHCLDKKLWNPGGLRENL